MCYSTTHRCPKHGYKGSMTELTIGNRIIAKCTEPGCNHETIWESFTAIDPSNGKQTIQWRIIK